MVSFASADWRRALAGLFLLFGWVCTEADAPRIAIVIDDMGHTQGSGRAALALPGAVTYAFLPHTGHAGHLARQAHRMGKEVMLHLPMQAVDGGALGPGALRVHMGEATVQRVLAEDLDSVPHVVGVNNHMGSLLTRHPGAMQWVMQGLRERGLYFIDSRTSVATVAEAIAAENAVPVARRNVFLDSERNVAAIRSQYQRMLQIARRKGSAIAIGHPYPETLAVLAEELPKLETRGILLVPASALTKTHVRKKLWHASSSPLPKVAKNSKPSPSSTCCDGPKSKLSAPD